jgi:hypothetical protein
MECGHPLYRGVVASARPGCVSSSVSRPFIERYQTEVIEKIHRSWPKDRDYLAPPDVGTLASLDPALILTPPRCMEAGCIPIATRQELAGAASRPHDQGKARY